MMAQLALQQSMNEITGYLAAIDEKVDDVLRAQKDAVLADMIGVDLVIEEALTIREHAAPAGRARGESGAPGEDRRAGQDLKGGRVHGAGVARRAGALLPAGSRARSVTGKLSSQVAGRAPRRRGDDEA
jgi:hypothetical protein